MMAWRRILASPAAKTFGSSSSSIATRPSATSQQSPMTPLVQSLQTLWLSTTTSQSTNNNKTTATKPKESLNGIAPEDRPFVHHGRRPRYHNYEKFKQPRKRASKLFAELNEEACARAKEATPHIWQHDIRVGDSIELRMISQGGIKPPASAVAAKATAGGGAEKQQEIEKIRGVVLGKVHRGLGSSLILRDVVYGLPIERRIPLYSPMIQECTVLERNFIFKGRKKVKRAKLYYFRDRNPLLTKVSKY